MPYLAVLPILLLSNLFSNSGVICMSCTISTVYLSVSGSGVYVTLMNICATDVSPNTPSSYATSPKSSSTSSVF